MKSKFGGCSRALWIFVAIAGWTLASSSSVKAEERTLGFEGLQSSEGVSEFYLGRNGSRGSGPGPSYGVSFGPDTYQLVYAVNGQRVLRATEGLGPEVTMNVSGGFSERLAFQYASLIGFDVKIYEGLNGTGDLIVHTTFPSSTTVIPYDVSSGSATEIPFLGTARSVVFSKRIRIIIGQESGTFALDNINFVAGPAIGLSSLATSAGPLYPAFSSAKTAYSVVPIISSDVNDLTLMPAAGSDNAILRATVNGGPVTTLTSEEESNPLPLRDGVNEIVVAVDTPGAESVTYTIRVARGLNQGPQGPPGPVGPQGPSGVSTVSPASGVFTLKKGGVRLVEDPLVTKDSVVYVQIVGGGSNKGELYAKYITDGKFRVYGPPGRRFRYVVIN